MLAYKYIYGSDGSLGVALGSSIEYGGSKRASISIWRPRFAPDPHNKADMIPDMGVVREADILSSWTLLETSATLMLINLAFGSRIAPMTGTIVQGRRYRSSFVNLRQG